MTGLLILLAAIIIAGGGIFFFMKRGAFLKIEALYKNRKYKAIIEHFVRNEKQLNNNIMYKFFFGDSLYHYKNYKECLLAMSPIMNDLSIITPKLQNRCLYIIADSFFNLGSFKDSFYYFYKLLKEDPNNQKALYSIARIYAGVNNFKKAIFHYNELKKLDKKNPLIYKEIGLLYIIKGDGQQAYKNLKIAKELDNKDLDIHFFFTVSLFLKHNFEKSLNNLKELSKLEISKTYKAEIYRMMGTIYQKLNNPKFAIQSYEAFLRLRTHTDLNFLKEVLYSLSLAYFVIKDYKNGMRTLQILYNQDKSYKDVADLIFKKEKLYEDAKFKKTLTIWNQIVSIKFPKFISENYFLIDKKLNINEVEAKLGLAKANNSKKKYTIEDYISSNYQEWVIINQSILTALDHYNLTIHRNDKDPDFYNGVGCWIISERKYQGKTFRYLNKFFRGKEFNKKMLTEALDLLKSLKCDRIAIYFNGKFNMQIINLASQYNYIELYNNKAVKEVINIINKNL